MIVVFSKKDHLTDIKWLQINVIQSTPNCTKEGLRSNLPVSIFRFLFGLDLITD